MKKLIVFYHLLQIASNLIGKIFLFLLLLSAFIYGQESLSNFQSKKTDGRSTIIITDAGQKLRLTPYGNYILRVQAIRKDEEFFPDNRYDMVRSHDWPEGFLINGTREEFHYNGDSENPGIFIDKDPVRLTFIQNNIFCFEDNCITWKGDTIIASFKADTKEHFAGLGHDYFGRVSKIDLRGETIRRNYGSQHRQQAPLIVPFYLSSKGYGVFLNSTFPNSFSFCKDGHYEFSISGGGQMDYFIIAGPEFEKILDRYTQLTGRPRFPPKAAFGLALSDKGNDHNSKDPSDEKWWKRKIKEHRVAGFPIDHIVNDNRWRAGGGQRCESYFDWDPVRYPDPAEYEAWIDSNNLFLTLDFNRCIASHSEGWKPEYNIPVTDSIEFNDSAPDLTRKEVRDWWWGLFWKKSLNPERHYPGDALWIDEFDEMGNAPLSMKLGNGRTWGEMKNYWFFLVAQALVRDGWDKSFSGRRRPFVWVRGMTAGAQRYATLWSGDIVPTYDEMKNQIRGLQAAGLSGFPFWGHDAGGFYDYQRGDGPDDNMYRQWSLAFGSFTPYWKPHGPGRSRWPLDRSIEVQKDAKKFCTIRYELMPYLYTYAHIASLSGVPVARAMIIDHQNETLAWEHDLQYMWGKEMLIAPNCSDGNAVTVWLPKGDWYDFETDSLLKGEQIIVYSAPIGHMPVFIKSGSIIPMSEFALSTSDIADSILKIHIYTGKDASFSLYEDDGTTEAYTSGEFRSTTMIYDDEKISFRIQPSKGKYSGASERRSFKIIYHGLKKEICFDVNNSGIDSIWDPKNSTQSFYIKNIPVSEEIIVNKINDCGEN